MTMLIQTVRIAFRRLRRSPLFTGITVVTLAVGIGAVTAIFSVVKSVLVEPLPYAESEELVWLNWTLPGLGFDEAAYSDGLYVLVRDEARSLDGLALWRGEESNLTGAGEPERVLGAIVTPEFFDLLRTKPALGRAFTPEDSRPGAEPVVILSHGLWVRRFGGDPNVLGQTLRMNGEPWQIVGVAPEGFDFPDIRTDLWRPSTIDESNLSPGSMIFPAFGRLAPGATVESAREELRTLTERVPDAYPDLSADFLERSRFAPIVQPLKERFVGEIRQELLIVFATVGLVLLIACANVANLFLVRIEGRDRELALRSALGAGRRHLAGHLLGESLILALAGGALGTAIADLGVRGLVAVTPLAIPRLHEVAVDGGALAFTLIVSVIAGLVFATFPLIRRRVSELSSALKEGGRSSTTSRERYRARNALVVGQVALALVLLIGSGLMVRSFRALGAIDPGFRTENALSFRLALPRADYTDATRTVAFWHDLRERLEALPGVRSVGAVSHLPLDGERLAGNIEIQDHPVREGEPPPTAERRYVTAGYFETMGIPILEGRTLETRDRADQRRSVVVNRSFAEHWWPSGSALGRRIRFSDREDWYEIVGVVGDVHFDALDQEPGDMIYAPILFGPRDAPTTERSVNFVVRAETEPRALLGPVRQAVWELDPRLPIADQRTLESIVSDSMARTEFTMAMLALAAALALLLGSVGLYGVLSYAVGQRTREIGVRLALGASAETVRGMVVGQGLKLVGIGVAVGLLGAVASARVLDALLYGVRPIDPLTYVAVVLTLVATGLLATYLPARRASATDPIEALRAE